MTAGSELLSVGAARANSAIGDDPRRHMIFRKTKRPTIVIVETFDRPRLSCIRVAQAFARPMSANVLICHWHDFDFAEGVKVQGLARRVTGRGDCFLTTIDVPLAISVMFFYGPYSGVLRERDTAALRRLAATGVDVRGVPLYIVVDRMMLEASRRGVVTNALGAARGWGPKHNQELKFRRYEKATGQVIVRPETYIASTRGLPAILSVFAERGESCLVKPTFGEGGRGFSLIRPGESFTRRGEGVVVVQQLISDPLLVHGHKADIRFYCLIDVDNNRVSGRLSPIFVRRAATPYVPMRLPAEITNTSYRSRLGLSPDMRPLSSTPNVSGNLHAHIVSQLNSLAAAFVNAYFWNAADNSLKRVGGDEIRNRVILFGIDVIVANPSRVPSLFFLETNPFPALFRGVSDCDQAVEEMLSLEYLPALMRSRAANS